MREIKFRAWDKAKKKMWSAEEMGRDQLTLSPDGRGFVNVHGSYTSKSQYLPHLIPLQYTGLKEYYEHDIVAFTVFDFLDNHENYIGVIKFTGGEWKIWVNGESLNLGSDGPFMLYWVDSQDDEMEVIGNIHETPELLEKQQ